MEDFARTLDNSQAKKLIVALIVSAAMHFAAFYCFKPERLPMQPPQGAASMRTVQLLQPHSLQTNKKPSLPAQPEADLKEKFLHNEVTMKGVADSAIKIRPNNNIDQARIQPSEPVDITTNNSVSRSFRQQQKQSATVFDPKLRKKISDANKFYNQNTTTHKHVDTFTTIHGQKIIQKGNVCFAFTEGHDETNSGYWSLPYKCGNSPTESEKIQRALHKALERYKN